MRTPAVFISYRRDDSVGHAGRLYDRLAQQLGAERVFRDLDGIPAGQDFVAAIKGAIEKCDVLLAVIGPRWLTAVNADGQRRLADEHDLVRIEIATGLKRGIRVIPVLLQGTTMPRGTELPPDLSDLSNRNAVEVRDARFDDDVEALLTSIAPRWYQRILGGRARWPVSAGLAALLVTGTAGAILLSTRSLTPERARAKIQEMGVRYEPAEFIRAAESDDASAARLVALFLKAGMDPNVKDRDGATALVRAAAGGRSAVVHTLLENGASSNGALEKAAAHGHIEIVRALLTKPQSADAVEAALDEAARAAKPEIVSVLLGAGSRVKANDWKALIEASENDSPENLAAVRLLLEHGADVNGRYESGWTALHEACEGRRDPNHRDFSPKVAALLLQKGARVDARSEYTNDAAGWTPLLVAIRQQRMAIARLLLDAGANPNVQAEDPLKKETTVTGIMVAAWGGVPAAVDLLLARGAKLDDRNPAGVTNLIYAASHSMGKDVALKLIARGADVNAASNQGTTALMGAACEGGTVLEQLVAKGADVNARDGKGSTALMNAASCGEAANVSRLMIAGARVNEARNDGKTALVLAGERDNQDVVRILRAPVVRGAR
ncbi:MAG: ankyrin repeat domain-containing protein [bacterium]